MKTYVTVTGAAVLAIVLGTAPASAACAWSTGMIKQEIELTAAVAPIAASAGKDNLAKFNTAMDAAREAVAFAELLNTKGDVEGCEYAIEAAREQNDKARQLVPKPKQS